MQENSIEADVRLMEWADRMYEKVMLSPIVLKLSDKSNNHIQEIFEDTEMKFTPTIGADLSGSIGGITASRNRGGSYFKVKSNPIQPNTQAQIRAKTNFGAGAKGFASLTSAEKSAWGNWAELFFTPRNPKTGSVPSGFQAFAAIQTLFRNAITANRTWTLEVDGIPLPAGNTFTAFQSPTATPVSQKSDVFWNRTTGDPLPMTVTAGQITALGDVEIDIQIAEGLGSAMSNFENGQGNNFGFAVYASNANISDNMNYPRPEQYLMGFLENPVATDIADLSSVISINLKSVIDFVPGEYQAFPIVGTFVNLSVYTVDTKLNMAKIGTIEVPVTFALV